MFKGVRSKSRYDCQRQIPDSAEKFTAAKIEKQPPQCSAKEGLEGTAQIFSCECCEIFKNIYFEKH